MWPAEVFSIAITFGRCSSELVQLIPLPFSQGRSTQYSGQKDEQTSIHRTLPVMAGGPKQLNKDFENVCNWFIDNKLSIHIGEDKTKSILFASKHKVKSVRKLNVKYKNKTTFAGYIS